jgi:D-amino-acid oxidase
MNSLKNNKGHALVLGGGVSGLTSALCLRDRGIRVTIIAEQLAPHITSVVAGALWEWPPAVCGYHHDEVSLARSKDWCMTSYRHFERLAADSSTGVYMRPTTFYFRNRVEEHALHFEKMQEISATVPGFRRDVALIRENGVNECIGLVDAYQHLAPMVDTDAYMAWLLEQIQASGIPILQRKVTCDLKQSGHVLLEEFDAEVIVNCTGLGSHEIAGEPMYPLRGAVIRLINDGRKMPRLTQAHCVSHDHITSDKEIVFIVPRGKDRIVLGAIAEANEWSTDIGLHNHNPIRQIYDRCVEFLPILKEAEIDPIEPVRVGLRPFRQGNVRLEAVVGTNIVHNYGHGGAGVTFSWGCAFEVAEHVDTLLQSGASAFGERADTDIALATSIPT